MQVQVITRNERYVHIVSQKDQKWLFVMM